MAIGVIVSPASWALGTVLSPIWAQNVQDSINGWYAGTNSLSGLALDGLGGQSVSPGGGNLQISGHIVSNGTALSGTAGAGLGSGFSTNTTATSDLRGRIQVTCGSTPSASAAVITMTFNTAYAAAPFVVLTPVNTNAAALSGTGLVFVSSSSTTNFVLSVGSTALTNGTTYQWNYTVIA